MMELNNRCHFIKKLSLSGFVFSGIEGFGVAKSAQAEDKMEIKHWDVIVIGGGPGGVPAAVAAARNGARVLLIENYGFLGGMATSALVMPYMKYSAGNKLIIRGLFEEFQDIMEENGGVKRFKSRDERQIWLNTFPTDLEDRAHFDDEYMKLLLDRFVLDSRCRTPLTHKGNRCAHG